MSTRIFFILLMLSLLFFSGIIAGCSSPIPSKPSTGIIPPGEDTPSLTTAARNNMELAIGEKAIVSGPRGSLEVTVRAFNATRGTLLIEEKNIGTDTFQYEPVMWLQDEEGIRYTTLYCHADICPGYVFFTTLPPQVTEKRELDNLYVDFQVPERGREGKLVLFWSNDGQEASWMIIPPQVTGITTDLNRTQ